MYMLDMLVILEGVAYETAAILLQTLVIDNKRLKESEKVLVKKNIKLSRNCKVMMCT